ncbi:MAG TPA: transposase [Rubrobacter sp.]|nr:transposase [Rubrobacter sp.]
MKGYDYTGDGAYFITIRTYGRAQLFGSIVDGEMRFNDYGRELANSWLAEQYPYVHLDEWVVMPDHMHAITVITDDRTGDTGSNVTDPYGGGIVPAKRRPFGRLIGAFKPVSTRRVNDIRSMAGARLWQRNYYEHIARDGRSLRCIREYISSKPSRWERERIAGTQR